MSILLKTSRNDPLVKPQQWGIERVDVLRNCDALGVGVPRHIFPLWSGGGAEGSIVSTARAVLTTARWSGDYVDFDSSGARILLDADVSLETYTVSIVFTPRSSGISTIYGRLWGSSSGLSDQLNFEGSLGSITLTVGGGNIYTGKAVDIVANRESCLTITSDGSTITTYVDGAVVSIDASTRNFDTSTALLLGNRSDLVRTFDGKISYFSISDKHESAGQIKKFHSRPYALLQPAPMPIWFDFGAAGGSSPSALLVNPFTGPFSGPRSGAFVVSP